MKNSVNAELYAAAFSKMEDFIYLLDHEGHLVDCNQNLLNFLGFDNLEADSVYEMMVDQGLWTSEQIQNCQQQDIDALISGKNSSEKQALINNKGTILHLEFSRKTLADPSGRALGLLVSIRDLSQQKKLNEQIKNLKAKANYNNQLSTRSFMAEPGKQANVYKVLLVEDNLIAQKAEKTILMACRCVTDLASTSRQANEIFKPGKYDLVLMDLTLEEGNGYQLTAVLRQREQGSKFRVPIIALTGHDPSEVGLNCEDAEMDGIIRKPLTMEQAKQLIQRYIRHNEVEVTGLRPFKH